MGWTTMSWSTEVSVSSHNSEQDDIDWELWEEMRKRLDEVRDDPKYADLNPR